jgi:hypothetical protein
MLLPFHCFSFVQEWENEPYQPLVAKFKYANALTSHDATIRCHYDTQRTGIN